ncbi:hypothetical protein BT96DRAFT_996815 [Gymnopus androsaceus JB14]|uniref:Uncharacterized protein n=1 Tax=Gymnopus androsaceus JB14 TaxID=1447944 RepID=A0A6A4HES3_9AGAR|nr:hypothetical protein BT96DRAFT_996815 [Gymnopus androsaceus JB14]
MSAIILYEHSANPVQLPSCRYRVNIISAFLCPPLLCFSFSSPFRGIHWRFSLRFICLPSINQSFASCRSTRFIPLNAVNVLIWYCFHIMDNDDRPQRVRSLSHGERHVTELLINPGLQNFFMSPHAISYDIGCVFHRHVTALLAYVERPLLSTHPGNLLCTTHRAQYCHLCSPAQADPHSHH